MARLSETTASAVRAAMKQRRVRQSDLAIVLGLDQAQISRRLAGRRAFTLDELEALAAYLEVPAGSLLEPPALLVEDVAS